MEKKSLVLTFLGLIAIFLWLLFVGQASGQSAFSGDINLIDEGQFAAWISHMLHGKVAYQDIYIQYGPFFVYPIFVLMKLFGQSMFFVRLGVGTLGAFLGICVLLVVLKYLKINRFFSLMTVVFLTIVPSIHIRHWLGIFYILFLVQMFRVNSKKIAFILGALLACTLLESVEVGIFMVFITFAYFVVDLIRQKKVTQPLLLLGYIFLGFGVVFGIFSFFVGKNILENYIQTTVEFLTSASGINLPNGQGLPNVWAEKLPSLSFIHLLQFTFSKSMLFYWSLLALIALLVIHIVRFLFLKTTYKDTVVFLIIIYTFLEYASIVGRSGHYFLVVSQIVLCAVYFLSLFLTSTHFKKGNGKVVFTFLCTLFVFFLVRHFIIFRYSIFSNFKITYGAPVTRVSPISISKPQAQDIHNLQVFFAKKTNATNTIYILNNAPGLYFLLDRENATRYDLPLLAGSLEKRLEIISSLKRNNPKYILSDIEAWAVDGVSDSDRMPEVFAFVQNNYKHVEKVSHYILYSKK